MHYDSCTTSPGLREFHGKAIGITIEDRHAPLPVLLLVHEYRVRGTNFYQPAPELEVTGGWQEWLVRDGVVNESDGSFTFNRTAPTSGPSAGPSTHFASTDDESGRSGVGGQGVGGCCCQIS